MIFQLHAVWTWAVFEAIIYIKCCKGYEGCIRKPPTVSWLYLGKALGTVFAGETRGKQRSVVLHVPITRQQADRWSPRPLPILYPLPCHHPASRGT